ncbi:sporulation protein YqfD [Clostridium sp. BJN0001]|uniref:sporulation protein YqfD n=1 Tax=Clostridium sp. BJN0001 TaxID=2930219 RepID=UPI001FD29038|nr:sporulation protein YqfD [Clostridium sp. BJN0001]
MKSKMNIIRVRVSSKEILKLINVLWNKKIVMSNMIRVDLVTIEFDIPLKLYRKTVSTVKKLGGKIEIVSKSDIIKVVAIIRSNIWIIIGIVLFFITMYLLSLCIWRIDIKTQNNLTSYEIRKELKNIGIIEGTKKSDINVYDIEKKIENIDSEIMWIRIRVEGASLKVYVYEKVNPPIVKKENANAIVASMDGEIKRVYTSAGNSNVKPGDIVKKGDVLISDSEGREEMLKTVNPKGTVIANTFYQKFMEVDTSGKKLVKTGKTAEDIFLNIFGKKIYLKKVINKFDSYDKIEKRDPFINRVIYVEKKETDTNKSKDMIIEESVEKLKSTLKKSIPSTARIIDIKTETEDISENKTYVKVVFTVEQNIASYIQ